MLVEVNFILYIRSLPHHLESLESYILIAWLFMGYTDNGESPLTDPDQPCSSSYEPTPINVPTEAATPINISTEGPKTKKTKMTKKSLS